MDGIHHRHTASTALTVTCTIQYSRHATTHSSPHSRPRRSDLILSCHAEGPVEQILGHPLPLPTRKYEPSRIAEHEPYHLAVRQVAKSATNLAVHAPHALLVLGDPGTCDDPGAHAALAAEVGLSVALQDVDVVAGMLIQCFEVLVLRISGV